MAWTSLDGRMSKVECSLTGMRKTSAYPLMPVERKVDHRTTARCTSAVAVGIGEKVFRCRTRLIAGVDTRKDSVVTAYRFDRESLWTG